MENKTRLMTRYWSWAVVALMLSGICLAFLGTNRLFAGENFVIQTAGGSDSRNPHAPSEMVWIPGGEYTMGTDDVRSFPNERPAHRVHVKAFWMDDVTPQAAAFEPRIGHPATYIDYSTLAVDRIDILDNIIRSEEFRHRLQRQAVPRPR